MTIVKRTLTATGLLAALLGSTACTVTTGGVPGASSAQIVYLEDRPFIVTPGGKLHPLSASNSLQFEDGGFGEPRFFNEPFDRDSIKSAGTPEKAEDRPAVKAEPEPAEPVMLAATRAEEGPSDAQLAAERAIAEIQKDRQTARASMQRVSFDRLAGGEDSADADLPSSEIVEAANRDSRISVTQAGYVNSVQVFPFEQGALYEILAAPRRLTAISLQPGETVQSTAAGDTVRWFVGETTQGSGEDARTVLILKPLRPDIATNIIVTTNRRTYMIEAHSREGDAYMASVEWTYPQDQIRQIRQAAAAADEREDDVIASGVDPMSLNYSYRIRTTEGGGFFGGDPNWKPVRVFDNGSKVYIQFPPGIAHTDAPALFVRRQGESQMVNYRVKGEYYVVDRLFDEAELRVGQDHAEVVSIQRKG